MKRRVESRGAPSAIGPYSQGVIGGGRSLLFTAGQLGMDPATGKLAEGIEEQTRRALENLKAVLEAAGSGMDQVLKVTVFLANMDDFAAMNDVYSSYFHEPFPARSAVEVARLPKGALVEIEAVAELG